MYVVYDESFNYDLRVVHTDERSRKVGGYGTGVPCRPEPED